MLNAHWVTRMIIILTVTVVFSTHAEVNCDSLKYQYYEPQTGRCSMCEKCLIGEETIPMDEWDIEVKHKEGPTECRKCVTCKNGTFSDVRAFQCKKCMDCRALEMYQESACTPQADTVCTDRIINVSMTTPEPFGTCTDVNTEDNTIQLNEGSENHEKINDNDSAILIGSFLGLFISIAVAIFVGVIVKNRHRRSYHSVAQSEIGQPVTCTTCVSSHGTPGCEFEDETALKGNLTMSKKEQYTFKDKAQRSLSSDKLVAKEGNFLSKKSKEMERPLSGVHRPQRNKRKRCFSDSFPTSCDKGLSNPAMTTTSDSESSNPSNVDEDGDENSKQTDCDKTFLFVRQFSYPCDANAQSRLPRVTDRKILGKLEDCNDDTKGNESELDVTVESQRQLGAKKLMSL